MNDPLPKQFHRLGSKPVIHHTIDLFRKAVPQALLIIVLPPAWMAHWQTISKGYESALTAPGGSRRSDSVRSGLSLIDDENGVVGIHDAVRPFAAPGVIEACFRAAEEWGACIPVIPPSDSLRLAAGRYVNREEYLLVQTPQCFKISLIKAAYTAAAGSAYADDASVAEAFGARIHHVPGNPENIKITTQFDLAAAGKLMESRQELRDNWS